MEQVQQVPPAGGEPESVVASRVLIDVSDLLMYLRHHNVVSGIQRVIVQVVPGIQARVLCEFVAYSSAHRGFVQLDRGLVEDLLDRVRQSTEANTSMIAPLVRSLEATIDAAPPYQGQKGDVLAVLGAAWIYDGFFKAVLDLKASGVAVTVLLYDLIPMVYPGFPDSVITPFRQYIPRVALLADRAPAISKSTRSDFEFYCASQGWTAPAGGVTELAADQWSGDVGEVRDRPWPRPFVLFVATIEARKNHILALRGWRELLRRHGRDAVPDLVCVGRIGWNCFEFLEEFQQSNGLDGKVVLLKDQVSDERLANLYRGCEFTIYPSRYEGWGLPVTESLMAGKPVIVARNSSLPEAGGQYAHYFEDNDLDDFTRAVEGLLDPAERQAEIDRIMGGYGAPTWDNVAQVLVAECRAAAEGKRLFAPSIVLGREYGLGSLDAYTGSHEGLHYLQFIEESRRLPLTGQLHDPLRVVMTDLLLSGHLQAPTSRGRPISAEHGLLLQIPRPSDAELYLVVAVAESQLPVQIRATGPFGPLIMNLPPGGAFMVYLGPGSPGDVVPLRIETTGPEGVVLTSFCVVDTRLDADILVERRLGWANARISADALDKVNYMENSISWRLTRPLRNQHGLAGRAKRLIMSAVRPEPARQLGGGGASGAGGPGKGA